MKKHRTLDDYIEEKVPTKTLFARIDRDIYKKIDQIRATGRKKKN